MAAKQRKAIDTTTVMLRMGNSYLELLDKLAEVHQRSRREMVEAVIYDVVTELASDKTFRLDYPDMDAAKVPPNLAKLLGEIK